MLIDNIFYLGIRHHGPGSAAAVLRALEHFKPEKILIEGAPEASPLLSFIGHEELQAPVAQLIYSPDDHLDSVFYPFTDFSPEWQALLFAKQHSIPVEFIDLPQAHSMAIRREARLQKLAQETEAEPSEDSSQQTDSNNDVPLDSLDFERDPLDLFAEAAGYPDGESWWEQLVEQQDHSLDIFSVIVDVMGSVREQVEQKRPISEREQRREAWMRNCIRKENDGNTRLAVICGAWHVPALIKNVSAKDDRELLKNLPKIKTEMTWIPWTYSRISFRSGYGAGVNSPGWYDYLWQHSRRDNSFGLAAGWLTQAARLLRSEGIDIAPASVIDAVRLADALAGLRERNVPTLSDMLESIQTLFGQGEDTLLLLLQNKLLIGERLGRVPAAMDQTPLQKDFQAQLKTLRLKTAAVEKELELDLRKDMDRARSQLFFQLQILTIGWAEPVQQRGAKGTFKENWYLRWEPECELRLIEKSIWGNTLASAAGAYALDKVSHLESVAELIECLSQLLSAGLVNAANHTIEQLNRRAATETHVTELMKALPGLVNIIRYGDVRGTDTQSLTHLVENLVVRVNIGLLNECRQLDEDNARSMADNILHTNSALQLLDNSALLQSWHQVLRRLSEQDSAQHIISGRCFRILEDAHVLSTEDVANALSLALSRAQDPMQAAGFVEGLLAGAGLLLMHNAPLWEILDHYVCQLVPQRFEELTPLLRRTFSTFAFGERRGLLDKLNTTKKTAAVMADDINRERAALVLPLLDVILSNEAVSADSNPESEA